MTNEIHTIQELCAAIGAGHTIQLCRVHDTHNAGWFDMSDQRRETIIRDFNDYHARIKPTPAPAPPKHPLQMSDVNLQRDLFRWKSSPASGHYTAHGVRVEGVIIMQTFYSFLDLFADGERSTDDGATWADCKRDAV